MNAKSPVGSKTIWINAIVAILAVWDQVQPFVPKEWMPKAIAIVAVLNVILRFFTNKPIKGGRGS